MITFTIEQAIDYIRPKPNLPIANEAWQTLKFFVHAQHRITQQGSEPSEIAAAEKLCKIYFEIAASCIGEEEVRKRVASATSAVA